MLTAYSVTRPNRADGLIWETDVSSKVGDKEFLRNVSQWLQGVGFATERSRVRSPAVPQVVCIRVPLSQTSKIRYRSRGGDALQLGR